MPDGPLYDPDRMVVEDLDLTDPAVVSFYLNHPTTEALIEDYGRQFRSLPAAEQRAELQRSLTRTENDHAQVVQALNTVDPANPSAATLLQLQEALQNYCDAIKRRLHELDDE